MLTIYRQYVIRLVVSLFAFLFKRDRSEDTMVDVMFIGLLLVATVPAGVLGVLFGDWIGETLSGVATVGYTLILTGLALWFIRNMRGNKGDGAITLRDATLIGLAQAVALIRGLAVPVRQSLWRCCSGLNKGPPYDSRSSYHPD